MRGMIYINAIVFKVLMLRVYIEEGFNGRKNKGLYYILYEFNSFFLTP